MKKIAILFFILGVLVGLFGAFTIRNTKAGPPTISDGYYRVYSLQKAYDTETGERIYWVIADSLKMRRSGLPIQQSKIRFYKIPRRMVRNLPDDREWRRTLSFLTVNDGKGMIDEMIWLPKVMTR